MLRKTKQDYVSNLHLQKDYRKKKIINKLFPDMEMNQLNIILTENEKALSDSQAIIIWSSKIFFLWTISEKINESK